MCAFMIHGHMNHLCLFLCVGKVEDPSLGPTLNQVDGFLTRMLDFVSRQFSIGFIVFDSSMLPNFKYLGVPGNNDTIFLRLPSSKKIDFWQM